MALKCAHVYKYWHGKFYLQIKSNLIITMNTIQHTRNICFCICRLCNSIPYFSNVTARKQKAITVKMQMFFTNQSFLCFKPFISLVIKLLNFLEREITFFPVLYSPFFFIYFLISLLLIIMWENHPLHFLSLKITEVRN